MTETNQTLARRATGPGTEQGKARSRLNAMKHGIFSQAVLLAGESKAEYRSLLHRLQEDLQPQGTFEVLLVEELATLLWRKRRLLVAERAEIGLGRDFKHSEWMENVALEAENREQLEMSSSGRRRSFSNPVTLESSIKKLKELKRRTQERALSFEEDGKTFREVYGEPPTGKLPKGFFVAYFVCALACHGLAQVDEVQAKERAQAPVDCLDKEIARFEQRKDHCENTQTQRLRHEEQASLVPRPDVADRLIRYEAHLSREFDRALSQLERRQADAQGPASCAPDRCQYGSTRG